MADTIKLNGVRCGVYVIRRIGSGECYVGQSIDLRKRWATHRGDLKAGRHSSRYLQRVYNKHGFGALEFEALEIVLPSDLVAAEQKWIERLRPVYNTCEAAGSCLGFRHSEETKRRMSLAKMGNKNRVGHTPWMKGKTHTPEICALISAKIRGRRGPNKGIPRSQEVKRKISLAKIGKPISPEQRLAISRALKGAPWSEKRRMAYLKSVGQQETRA